MSNGWNSYPFDLNFTLLINKHKPNKSLYNFKFISYIQKSICYSWSFIKLTNKVFFFNTHYHQRTKSIFWEKKHWKTKRTRSDIDLRQSEWTLRKYLGVEHWNGFKKFGVGGEDAFFLFLFSYKFIHTCFKTCGITHHSKAPILVTYVFS